MKIFKSICAASLASLLLAASCDYGPGEARPDRANCFAPSDTYVWKGVLRGGSAVCAPTIGGTFNTSDPNFHVRWVPHDIFAGEGCGWVTDIIPFPGAMDPYYIDTWYRQMTVPELGLWWCSPFSYMADIPNSGEPGNPCNFQIYTCHHPVNP